MKRDYFQKYAGIFVISIGALFASGCSSTKAPSIDARTQQLVFASPEDAVTALRSALEKQDKQALLKLFGPDAKDLVDSGDKVADAERMKKFAARLAEGSSFIPLPKAQKQNSATNTFAILVGANEWPLPIPLVQENGTWRFDTAIGKQEILNREIGNNELRALSVCVGVVDAEKEYHQQPRTGNKVRAYATKFLSSKNKHDGLYWESKPGEPQSPIGPLVAKATLEGYRPGTHKEAQPYHGYYYRILTSQGDKAPGGTKNYLKNGLMTGGFALVAYPAKWRVSGVMTFIVGFDGIVYEKNLGENTAGIASKMSTYNPDKSWSKVGKT